MLFGAVTVIVVIAAGDPHDGSTEALERALRSAVGDRAVVVVKTAEEGESEDPSSVASDPDALVGVVTWSDHRRRASLRFRSSGRASERELRFDAADAPAERGRTVGFAVASMVPEDAAERAAAAKPAAAPAVGPSPAPPPVAAPPAESPSVLPRDPTTAVALDLVASGAVGVRGYGGGLGGALGGRIPLGRGFAARIALAARFGEIAPAQATSHAYAAAGGIAWQVWPTASRSFGLGVRADVLVMRHEVVHLSADDPEAVSESRFLPGVDLLLEGGVRLADHAAILIGFGPELALGRTNILVRGAEVGVVPPLRLCAEGGVRVSF